ncbi:MAG: hypothetical protein V3U80_00600 [Flavobacteriaceae bacterium]
MEIEIKNIRIIDVPSASGIAKLGDSYYAIGDDSPYLFTLNTAFNIIKKQEIYPTDKLDFGTFRKKDKPDFETIEIISNTEMIVFGSGSKSPKRDVFIHLKNGKHKIHSMTPFYNELKNLDALQGYELNIEGSAYHDGHLHLFNRGKNIIFTFFYSDLMAYFKNENSFPQPKITLYNLPKINGISYGFSGATAFQYKPYLLFTASGENTKNAYDDGEILGSIVGVIALDENKPSQNIQYVTIPNAELPLKIEAVTIANEIADKQTKIIFVTDSDGGESLLLNAVIKW